MELIEKILNLKKIRYEYMDPLFKKFSKSFVNEGTVNIFIDIPSTIKQFNNENLKFSNLTSIINDNYKICKILIESIPHAYFIDTMNIDFRCIFNYIYKHNVNENDINIILTTDDIFYQYTSFENTLILEPKAEHSNIVYVNNVMKSLAGKSKTLKDHPDYLSLNAENVILLQAMSNQKKYNISGIRNFAYAKSIIFLNKNNINLNNQLNNTEIINDIFNGILKPEEIDTISKNINIFNGELILNRNERKLDLIISKQLNFIYQPKELRSINEKYFKKNPLILDYMFEGEDVKK